jgi:hypothetical protein
MSEQSNEPQNPERGAPSGNWFSRMSVPVGIEVLVKKAAVDSVFRRLLFRHRGSVAASIGIQLDPAEFAMLKDIPEQQLAQIVRQATVPPEHVALFHGDFGPAMLAAVRAGIESSKITTLGSSPDRPEGKEEERYPYSLMSSFGNRPDDAEYDAKQLTEWIVRHRNEWRRARENAARIKRDEPGRGDNPEKQEG